MIIGLCAVMNNLYYVTSNREAGDGRYDVQLLPYNKRLPGILMELKVLRETPSDSAVPERLEALSQIALEQINDKNYDTGLLEQGVGEVMKFGIAFYKKQVKILSEIEKIDEK